MVSVKRNKRSNRSNRSNRSKSRVSKKLSRSTKRNNKRKTRVKRQRNRSNNFRRLIGGSDIVQANCFNQVDTTRYTQPCAEGSTSLPLDPGFGGDIVQPNCFNYVDTTRYTQPCSEGSNSLPLDPGFSGGNLISRHFQTGGRKQRSPKKPGCGCSSGGGYTVEVGSSPIGGRPQIISYPDTAPPVFVDNQAIFSSDGTPLCGQYGGELSYETRIKKLDQKFKSLNTSHSKHKGGKLSKKLKRKSQKNKRKRNAKRSNRINRRQRRKRQQHNKYKNTSMSGGDLSAFFRGPNGNFSADMSTHQFDCNQPDWSPNCS